MTKTITKTKTRRVQVDFRPNGFVDIVVREHYIPFGYQRGKWSLEFVTLTSEEWMALQSFDTLTGGKRGTR